MTLTYAELTERLFPRLTGGIRWGLERTLRLLADVGDPHLAFRAAHVAGTNGKGSAAATMASVLRAPGRRTGLYTSPHLVDFRERIQVDGRPIAEAALLRAADRLWPSIEREAPSFFEATTALAFLALAEAGVDVAVVEVGLGGRLDATNVIRPDVVLITSVALDHAQYLGSTLPEIAAEKAGIIKAGVPVVSAECGPATLPAIRARAREVRAPLHVLEPDAARDLRVGADGTRFTLDTDAWGELALHSPLVGGHQARNVAGAVRALELLPQELRPTRAAVERGVAATRWPGRMQVERRAGVTWVFDAAHNPAGVEALSAALAELRPPRPWTLLLGVLGDKDWSAMLPPLLAVADAAVLTQPPSAPQERRWDPRAALAAVPAPHAVVVPEFEAALREAARAQGTVIVTGSFHTVGDAMLALEIAPFPDDAGLPPSSSPV